MKRIIISSIMLLFMNALCAQTTSRLHIRSGADSSSLPSASVNIKGYQKIIVADSSGLLSLPDLTPGKHKLTISHVGYEEMLLQLVFPLEAGKVQDFYLAEAGDESEEVIVTSTRTSRSIANTPTRIETIDGEELDEKNNMRPANVSMLLHESTGMQVQQTSATSGNASIRVQGLDGRYTQLLKDGYPNFGNFAGGLSVLEIPPLDLKQVEVIKGPASTLYGGGAIAGVVNFISKSPGEKAAYEMLFNQSHIGQTNIGGYASQRKGHFGYTFMGLVNFQKAYDVDKDEFSEIPKSMNFTINPRIFYYPNSSTTIMIGNSYTQGTNTGGDMAVIKGNSSPEHSYFEKNTTYRNISTLEFGKTFTNKSELKLKQSLSVFNRNISIPGYVFAGKSVNSFTDLSLLLRQKNHTMITGVNFLYDKFRQQINHTLNSSNTTAGIYFQDTWDASGKLKFETGIRIDRSDYKSTRDEKAQFFFLPRISALFRITDKISSRIGAGLGYKSPTIFTEQSETMQYQNIAALKNVEAERSAGGTADINFKTRLATGLQLGLNQMFFYTRINKPLVMSNDSSGANQFSNASKPVTSAGFETNLKLIYRNTLKLFAGYTFTDAKATYLAGNQFLPLLPKHKLNLALMYEKDDNFKLGLEAYLTGKQYLYNGIKTASFWELGFMAQKTFGKISIFVNFENFTDERQSKYKTVVNPPHNAPAFDDIWNHTEGFVVNGGLKLKF